MGEDVRHEEADEQGLGRDGEGSVSSRRPVRHRDHRFPRRERRITVRLSDQEHDAIVEAARGAWLTPAGYVAAAAVATATATKPPVTSETRDALVELMQARAQLRRLAVNVNQAVAALNATGEAPAWLHQALELAGHAVSRIDDASHHLMRNRS